MDTTFGAIGASPGKGGRAGALAAVHRPVRPRLVLVNISPVWGRHENIVIGSLVSWSPFSYLSHLKRFNPRFMSTARYASSSQEDKPCVQADEDQKQINARVAPAIDEVPIARSMPKISLFGYVSRGSVRKSVC